MFASDLSGTVFWFDMYTSARRSIPLVEWLIRAGRDRNTKGAASQLEMYRRPRAIRAIGSHIGYNDPFRASLTPPATSSTSLFGLLLTESIDQLPS